MTRHVGNLAEDLAVEILQKKGYQILTQNFTCRAGEIDIVAQKEGTLCFIEVKSRTNLKMGLPQEAVSFTKKRRLITAAMYYLKMLGSEPTCRFDVVSVYPSPSGGTQIEIIEGAFSL